MRKYLAIKGEEMPDELPHICIMQENYEKEYEKAGKLTSDQMQQKQHVNAKN